MEHEDWQVRLDAERALRLVRLKKKSNFLTLPELLRVLTHLIENAVSALYHGTTTAPSLPPAATIKQ